MRAYVAFAIAALVLAAVAVAGAGASTASSHTALTITYWNDGRKLAEKEVWTLRCDPPRGTLARPAVACRRLAAGGWKLVAPVPPGSICTEIYGGPQVARMVGYLEGRKVWARFSREDGCRIARWNRLSPWLLPPGGVTS